MGSTLFLFCREQGSFLADVGRMNGTPVGALLTAPRPSPLDAGADTCCHVGTRPGRWGRAPEGWVHTPAVPH